MELKVGGGSSNDGGKIDRRGVTRSYKANERKRCGRKGQQWAEWRRVAKSASQFTPFPAFVGKPSDPFSIRAVLNKSGIKGAQTWYPAG